MTNPVSRVGVLIVGSGGNGMSVAVKLLEAGIDDIAIITKHQDFGGTWLQNTYPGCAVNAEFPLYQFTYALSREGWGHWWGTQPEILAYMQKVARDHQLYDYARFGVEMLDAQWLEDEACWSVQTTAGPYLADALVVSTGWLEKPRYPEIEGMETFEGRMFHSSIWPDGYTGAGERVAVVGGAASGIQIIPPLAEHADQVVIFQTRPMWILPKDQRVLSEEERAAFRDSPDLFDEKRAEAFERWETRWESLRREGDMEAAARMAQECVKRMEQDIDDPELRRLLTPDFPFGGAVPSTSNTYYKAMTRDNVVLVPERATRIGPTSIASAGGREFEVDTIVLATGFYPGIQIHDLIKRRDGRSIREAQAGHPRAYKSVSTAGCPNLFLVGGAAPNGSNWNGLASGEIVGGYIAQALTYMKEHGIRALEVDEQLETEWKREIDAILDRTITVKVGLKGHPFLDETGHNWAQWPVRQVEMRRIMSKFDPAPYHEVSAA